MKIKGMRKMTATESNSYNMGKGTYITTLTDEKIKESLTEYGKKSFAWENIIVTKRGDYEWEVACMGDGRQESIYIVQE